MRRVNGAVAGGRMRIAIWALVLTAGLGGCPEPGVGPGAPDAGRDGGASDGGGEAAAWPEAERVLENATNPALTVSADGTIRLAYQQDGWIRVGELAGGDPVDVAEGDYERGDELWLSSAPDADRALLVWNPGWGAWLVDGALDGAPFRLAELGLVNLSPAWTRVGPVVTARTGDFYRGDTLVRGKLVAFRVEDASPVPVPSDAEALEAVGSTFYLWGERERLVDLGERGFLVFRMSPERNPEDPDGVLARWWRLRSTAASRYLEVVDTGTLAGLSAPRWIQPWDLGDGRFALTWCAPTNSLVQDVFVAELSIDASGVPTLAGPGENVSLTSGLTDNSDDPRLLPTGDGRFWLAWRESSYGPRAALLGPDLSPTHLFGPREELESDTSAQLDAVVDADGNLVLAASFTGDRLRVRVFRLPLPG